MPPENIEGENQQTINNLTHLIHQPPS